MPPKRTALQKEFSDLLIDAASLATKDIPYKQEWKNIGSPTGKKEGKEPAPATAFAESSSEEEEEEEDVLDVAEKTKKKIRWARSGRASKETMVTTLTAAEETINQMYDEILELRTKLLHRHLPPPTSKKAGPLRPKPIPPIPPIPP